MSSTQSQSIEKLREFNRKYTERLGFLRQKLDESPFSLSEARLLYELAQAEARTAADLAKALDLDPAQVSRTMKRFIAKGLVAASTDPNHGKQRLLSLTREGRTNFAALESKTRAAIEQLLQTLPPYRRVQLIAAAEAMSAALDDANVEVRLRDLRPGDLGLVISRQAALYAQEYGWNADYEALVAGILADFVRSFDASRDEAWIADIDGEMVGSIFLVHSETAGVGKLRLLYVEPSARGMGIGQSLVSTCIVRAREAGYQRLDLWTNSVLSDARRIYERAGFRLVSEEAHRSFGHDLVGQTWSLDLDRIQAT
jgi:DNA-binding MarR family transcriptional regulator/GNAT superfamily N-acetyltransferase